ncbi:MAG: polysaccharide deacetylase family protein [Ferrimonas sp.]
MITRYLAWLSAMLMGLSLPTQAVVILQYHHVSTTTPSSTSVTPEQFQTQMHYLRDHGFNVVPLSVALNAIDQAEPLPPRSVAITFDDGFVSVATHAHPILKALNYPYTVFVNVAPIEAKHPIVMDWPTLRRLAHEGATIANHSYAHHHLIQRLPNETSAQWRHRIQQDIETTAVRIQQETGHQLKALAYPYGEYNRALQALLQELGYWGLGQHSGAAGPYSERTAIPRFSISGDYAELDSLTVKLHSLHMPVQAIDGADPELIGRPRPSLTITLDGKDVRTDQLMCYIQGQGAKAPHWLTEHTFVIQADRPLAAGPSRYNCTAPSRTHSGYYWFSQPWFTS